MVLESAQVTCPACWQTVELSVDLSAGDQVYVEDCPVCCQPMVVTLRVDEVDPEAFHVEVSAENG